MGSTVVGLDIGTSSVRAVELQDADKAKPTVLRFDELALPPGAVHGGEVAEPNTVATSLKRLWSQAGFRVEGRDPRHGQPAGAGARTGACPGCRSTASANRCPSSCRSCCRCRSPTRCSTSTRSTSRTASPARWCRACLVAAVKDAVLANVRAVQLARPHPDRGRPAPVRAEPCHRQQRPGDHVALVDVGAATTNVLITQGGVPQFARIIPVGGDDLDGRARRPARDRLRGRGPHQAHAGSRQRQAAAG